MTDYKILSSTSTATLEGLVRQWMAQGWGPHGNPLITYVYDINTKGYVYTYYQAMVKP
jgi:hypothetical protein